MVRVKICGITTPDDAAAAVDGGADALGFVFFRGSPRYITPERAYAIVKELPSFVTTVGVFVNEQPQEIDRITSLARLDIIQLHGDEKPEACRVARRVVKAIRIKSIDSLEPLRNYREEISAFLLDAYAPDSLGGTGLMFNWDIAVEAKQFGRIILAGGLTPENVQKAIRHVRPYAVDVSSGVERVKGKKDHQKLKLFIDRAKNV